VILQSTPWHAKGCRGDTQRSALQKWCWMFSTKGEQVVQPRGVVGI